MKNNNKKQTENSKKQAENGKKQIDWEKADLLFSDLCSVQEAAAALQVTPDELKKAVMKTFKIDLDTYIRQKQANTLHEMRLAQKKLSETNATMSIWLGKQYLGQRDRKDDDAVIPDKHLLLNELEDFFE